MMKPDSMYQGAIKSNGPYIDPCKYHVAILQGFYRVPDDILRNIINHRIVLFNMVITVVVNVTFFLLLLDGLYKTRNVLHQNQTQREHRHLTRLYLEPIGVRYFCTFLCVRYKCKCALNPCCLKYLLYGTAGYHTTQGAIICGNG